MPDRLKDKPKAKIITLLFLSSDYRREARTNRNICVEKNATCTTEWALAGEGEKAGWAEIQ
jgi:hypothetical protein